MSGAVSPATGHAYGLARVARVWRRSRATVYRHRTAAAAETPRPARRGPVGACSDAALVEYIRAQILGSRLHGEGYRVRATARFGPGCAMPGSAPRRAGFGG
jgi:putative transposase